MFLPLTRRPAFLAVGPFIFFNLASWVENPRPFHLFLFCLEKIHHNTDRPLTINN